MSPIGEAVTMLPASVARLRIWREAKAQSILSTSGYSPASASSSAVSVAAPPTVNEASLFVICVSSRTPSVETRSAYRRCCLLM